jgi:hypothetical protein
MAWLGYWQLNDLGGVDIVTASPGDVVIKEKFGIIHMYEGQYETGQRQAGYLEPKESMSVDEMKAIGDRLYTLDSVGGGELTLIDLGDRGRPVVRARAPVTTALPLMAVAEPLVYATAGSCARLPGAESGYSLLVLELTGRGTELREVGNVPLGLYIRNMAVAAHYAYVVVSRCGGYNERLALFDLEDPTQPRFVSNVPLDDGVKPKNVVVRDSRAYVAVRKTRNEDEAPTSGLDVLDVSKPRRSKLLGSVRTQTVAEESTQRVDKTCRLALSGNYALYSCDEPVVHIVDVSEPRRPVEAQRLDVAAIVTDLDAAAGHAYVVTKDGGMLTLRATHPQPELNTDRPVFLPLAVTSGGGFR